MNQQAVFSGGLNACAAPDKLAEDEVQYAQNIDFSLIEGAAVCRRGSRRYADIGVNSRVKALYINHNKAAGLGSDPMYAAVASSVYRGVSGTFAAINTCSNNELVPFSFWDTQTVFANGSGTGYRLDDGTTVTQWVKEAPGTAPTVTVTTSYVARPASSWTALEGTITSSSTASCTATESAGLGRISLSYVPASTALNTDAGGYTIGDWGVHYWTLKFSAPETVEKVSIDYSIGDTNFNNYYHSEIYGDGTSTNTVEAADLVDAAVTGAADANTPIGDEERTQMFSSIRIGNTAPTTQISKVANAANVIGIPRPEIYLVGKYASTGWADIKAIRIIVESDGDQTLAVGDFIIGGSEGYPLTDLNAGLHYWETWATLNADGDVLYESAPSPISTDIICQHAYTTATAAGSPAGADSGITHRIFYRSGGYLRDAYAVGTVAIATTTLVDRTNDISILSDANIMTRGIYSQSNIPGNITCISEPHFDRLFAAHSNKVIWSAPGQPSSFPKSSETVVSHAGDEVYSLVSWNPVLVIINRDSVYEMQGSLFEGADADWTLFRTGCKRGTKAPKVSIRTPYGIPLLDYDGLYMYTPGSGVEQPIQWFMDKVGDIFRGELSTDPAALKGNRAPFITRGYIRDSFAIYANDKLYLAVPVENASQATVIYVLDFLRKRVWFHRYPFLMTCGAWDFVANTLYVGTSDGKIMEIEYGITDQTTAAVTTGIGYNIQSRQWNWPSKNIITNLTVDLAGTATGTVHGSEGAYIAVALGTGKNARYKIAPSPGGFEDSAFAMTVYGTQTTSAAVYNGLYGFSWDSLALPEMVKYSRTPPEIPGGEQEWKAIACELDCLNNNVLGTLFVDATAVSTYTFTGSGPQGYVRQIPGTAISGLLNHTYGRSAYMIYVGTSDFRHYNTWYEKVAEPSRTTHWRTETEIDAVEQEYKTINCELNCLGATVLSTVVVDNVAISTHTSTGTGYLTYTYSLPSKTYGKSIYTQHESSAVFKHYRTWHDKEPSHNRVTVWRTPTEVSQTETEWKAACAEIDCLGGVVLGTVFIEETAIATITCSGSGYQTYTKSLPTLSFGRAAYVLYNSTTAFKPYKSWFISEQDPTRVTSWREKSQIFEGEQEFRTVEGQIDCLGGTTTGTVFVDSTAVSTFTLTGSGEQGWVKSLPAHTYGRAIYTIYNSSGSFKPFATWYHHTPEPSRVTIWRTPTKSYSSEQLLRTWTAELNPITPNSPVVGTLYKNDTAVMTNTFVYSGRDSTNVSVEFTTGLTTMAAGDELYALYTATTPFKHYETTISVEPTPYKKRGWIINYAKIGGADQLDTARFWQLDIDADACVATCVWDVDGHILSTSTVTHTGGRVYYDRIPVAPGLRGYLFRLRVNTSLPSKIWASSLDIQMTGVKGLVRRQRREGTVEAPTS